MKTGFFKTNYSNRKGKYTCRWIMIFGKCLFVQHKKVA